MKHVAVAVAILTSTPAIAQDHAQHHAPAATATTAPTVAAKFSLDTPVETLMADATAKAAVEANVPGISTHQSYDMFKSMSLTQLSAMAPDRLTPDVLAKTRAALAVIK